MIDFENNVCSDNLWDMNKTWNTDKPDFTNCFKDIIINPIPLVFITICAPFEIYVYKIENDYTIGNPYIPL